MNHHLNALAAQYDRMADAQEKEISQLDPQDPDREVYQVYVDLYRKFATNIREARALDGGVAEDERAETSRMEAANQGIIESLQNTLLRRNSTIDGLNHEVKAKVSEIRNLLAQIKDQQTQIQNTYARGVAKGKTEFTLTSAQVDMARAPLLNLSLREARVLLERLGITVTPDPIAALQAALDALPVGAAVRDREAYTWTKIHTDWMRGAGLTYTAAELASKQAPLYLLLPTEPALGPK